MAEVRLEGVTKVFPVRNIFTKRSKTNDAGRAHFSNEVNAVKDISFTALDHEFVVLVGPSGCGKTTILRIIAGLEQPSSGNVYIDQKPVNDIPPKDRDVAMVFQNYALYPHMTVFENMSFGLEMRRFSKDEIGERVHETARILGIEDLLDRKPKQLSGGQRQRVAVGRAIVRKPQAFLFDEPLSNLDAKLRVQMRAELSRLHQQLRTTIIYVTHDQIEAMTLGQKIVVLKDGEIQQVDTPQSLYHHPKNIFVAGFIGSPPMNFINVRFIRPDQLTFSTRNTCINWSLDDVDIPTKFINQDVVLGLRPEDLYLDKDGRISLLIEVIEPVGGEVYAYGKFLDIAMCVSLPKGFVGKVGETIRLNFNHGSLYLFDAISGQAIQ